MEQSSFITYLPLITKHVMFLDVKTKRFVSFIVAFKLCLSLFFIFSTISCFSGNDNCPSGNDNNMQDLFPKYHDLLLVALIISVDGFILVNKHLLCSLIEFIVQPWEEWHNNVQPEISKGFNKYATVYGQCALAFFVILVPAYSSAPLFLFLFASGGGECIDAGLTWVSTSASYNYKLLLHIVSVVSSIAEIVSIELLFLTMALTVLKIRYTIRVMCADLDDINRKLNWFSEPETSGIGPTGRKEEEPTSSGTRDNHSKMKKASRGRSKKYGTAPSLQLLKNSNERVLREQIKLYFSNVVEQHIKIMRYVRQADEMFRHQMMVYVQIGILTVAMAVPKLNSVSDLINGDNINRGAEIIGVMTVVGVAGYIGQKLASESASLRQTLYNCDWTDKPRSLRQGLLIMQTVATRPLRLTLGGVYTLDLETYGNILRATYSYISLIQSQN